MKKLFLGFVGALAVAGAVFADSTTDTETYTNALGQVFTVVVGEYGTNAVAVTLTSNENDVQFPAVAGMGVVPMYVSAAAAVTNVSFASVPLRGMYTLINVNTNSITLADSATFVTAATALGQYDAATIMAVSTGLTVCVGAQNN